MKKYLLAFFIIFGLLLSYNAVAQKTFKVVCDKTDNKIKIVDGEDRSPNLVPVRGGFPFYQVAQNWAKENYPDGSCDANQIVKLNQTQKAADQAAVPARPDQPQALPPAPAVQQPHQRRNRNTSVVMSALFSNLGAVYGLDPYLVAGFGLGAEQLIGSKYYFGLGVHFNTLAGNIETLTESLESQYYLKMPIFAGFRNYTGNLCWKAELGVSINSRLTSLTEDWNLGGEVASDGTASILTRIKGGNEKIEIEFGADMWLMDILTTMEGFKFAVLTLGLRFSF